MMLRQLEMTTTSGRKTTKTAVSVVSAATNVIALDVRSFFSFAAYLRACYLLAEDGDDLDVDDIPDIDSIPDIHSSDDEDEEPLPAATGGADKPTSQASKDALFMAEDLDDLDDLE